MSDTLHPHAIRHCVLVVDDDATVRDTLSDMLARDGIETLTAADAEEALAILATRVPCMLLIDVMMPGMDGYELCRRVRRDPRTARVPIALITGKTGESDIEEGLAAGAVDFFWKPFDSNELRLRLRTQILLHESNAAQSRLDRYLAVVSEVAADAIIIIDNAGTVVHWNHAAEVIFGYARREAIGRLLHELVVPERFRETHRAAFPLFQTTGTGRAVGRTVELVALRRSGEEFPVELALSPVLIDNAWCAVGIVRDITERRRMEQEARETAVFLRTLLDAIPVPVYYKDVEGRYVGVNRALAQFYGRTQEEMIGKTLFDLVAPDVAPYYYAMDRELLQNPGVQVYEGEVRDAAGTMRQLVIHRATYAGPDGQIKGIIGVMLDITERKHAETQLGHARKLEAVGQLAAGIAHEINTPTQYVGDSVQFIREAFNGYHRLVELGHQAAAARDIALAFGVPPVLAGLPGDATYSNYREANRALWRQTVLPLASRIGNALTQWLAPAFGAGLTLAVDADKIEALSGDRAALWERVTKAPFLTVNEKRAATGYGAVEGGDGFG
jgi:PAS domain S-box-containing protein